MVNKEAKIAVYFYDDGSRGRQVLRDFLDKTEIDALQSDGFRSSLSRLLPTGRKNSQTFGSHAGAKVSVIYHTFIETCKMCGVSTLEYFKEFFKAIMQGRTDYENMLPMTIGIKK